jgi:teichuronic acid biosynthesis glycosyltransferase TuaH
MTNVERLPGNWDGMVVVCGGTSWDGVPFCTRHIASRLTDYAPVLYVDPPMSHMTARRHPHLQPSLDEPRLRVLRDGLARLTPVAMPGMTRPGMHVVTELLVRRALRRAVKTLGGRVRAVVAGVPSVYFGACDEELKVVYATDDFVAGASLMGLSETRLIRDERRQARQADFVLTVSPALSDKWRSLGQTPILVPNGCDAAHYATTDEAPRPADVDLPEPIAGFVGHISARIDIALLEAVAARGTSLLLVGPREPSYEPERFERLVAGPNVRWVGPKPFAELPSYLRLIDVGLTPYGESDFNQASFPLKTLEYLAAGRGVVATDLPAVRWLDTELVTIASGPDDFANAVERALAQPRTPELTARRRAVGAEHSWTARAQDVARILGLGPAQRTGREAELVRG